MRTSGGNGKSGGPEPQAAETGRALPVSLGATHCHAVAHIRGLSLTGCLGCAEMFANVQKTQELWMWKMEYLHHEQRPLYFGEWF